MRRRINLRPHGNFGPWVVASTLVLLVVAGAVFALARLPRTYQSASSVVLLASPATSKANGGNPYLSFSPSLTLAAELVSTELMAPSTARSLAARGFGASYTVTLATYSTTTTSSVLLVTVSGKSSTGVEHSLQGVTEQVGRSLANLQAGEKPYDRIRALTISMNGQARLSVAVLARSLAVVVILLLVPAVGVMRAYLAYRGRRPARQRQSVPAPQEGGVPAAPRRRPRMSAPTITVSRVRRWSPRKSPRRADTSQ